MKKKNMLKRERENIEREILKKRKRKREIEKKK